MRTRLLTAALAAGLAASMLPTTGCHGTAKQTQSTKQSKSLYERLGGRPAVAAAVENFVDRTGRDPRLNARFSNTDIPHLKAVMVDHIGEATGGPFKYTGKDMRTSHAGMKITDAEFGFFMENLKATLDELKIGAQEQKEVLAFFNSLKADVVGQ